MTICCQWCGHLTTYYDVHDVLRVVLLTIKRQCRDLKRSRGLYSGNKSPSLTQFASWDRWMFFIFKWSNSFFFCSALKLQNTDPTSIDPVIVQYPYPVPVCKKRCYYYLTGKLCRWSPSKPWGWGRRNILHLSEWRNPWALVSSFHRGDQNQTKSWERDLQVVQ